MNRRLSGFYLLGTLLLMAACGGESVIGPQRTAMIARSWPASEIREIKIVEVSGTVRVEAADTNEVSLAATVKGRRLRPKSGAENQGLFRTDLDGDTLHISRRSKKRNINFFFGGDNTTIHYVLKVPSTVSLDMKTVNGRIATRGIEGETEASSVNGTIDVEVTGKNEVSASTVNGRVRAKFTHDFQGARFKSVNGGVEAILPNDASFSVDLSQVNGDFEASFPLSIHSRPGSRRVSGEVNGGQHRLKITTVNGDVELMRLGDL